MEFTSEQEQFLIDNGFDGIDASLSISFFEYGNLVSKKNELVLLSNYNEYSDSPHDEGEFFDILMISPTDIESDYLNNFRTDKEFAFYIGYVPCFLAPTMILELDTYYGFYKEEANFNLSLTELFTSLRNILC